MKQPKTIPYSHYKRPKHIRISSKTKINCWIYYPNDTETYVITQDRRIYDYNTSKAIRGEGIRVFDKGWYGIYIRNKYIFPDHVGGTRYSLRRKLV